MSELGTEQIAGEPGAEARPAVSVAIVNFNGGPLVTKAVGSVLRSTVPVEVFVVDNGSSDGSLQSLQALARDEPALTVIDAGQNLGFTRASNRALRCARADYVLLLNPDCLVQPDTLERMLRAIANYPEVAMAGCLIRNPDGTEQAGCRRAIPTPWRTVVRVLHLNKLFPNRRRFRTFLLNLEPLPEAPVTVEAISGAFMLVKRAAMEQVGLLDEGYFLHCDDLDWCMRFRAARWQILFVPDVEVVHYKGTSSKGRAVFVEWHKHKGMVRFYRKFFRRQYPGVLMSLVVVGVWLRFGMVVVYHGIQWFAGDSYE